MSSRISTRDRLPFSRSRAPVLRALDAETAHQLAIRTLCAHAVRAPRPTTAGLRSSCFGRRFPNPVGLAAGFDKQCEVPDQLLSLGFGFVEFGGVVPHAAAGQSAPARFPSAARRGDHQPLRAQQRRSRSGIEARLPPAARASRHRRREYRRQQGRERPRRRLRALRRGASRPCRLRDDQRVLAEHAGPARPAGRGLPRRPPRPLHRGARRQIRATARSAVLLKIAPDISLEALDAIVATALRRRVDGADRVEHHRQPARRACARKSSRAKPADCRAGRSSRLSTRLLARNLPALERRMPLVGVGGVDSGERSRREGPRRSKPPAALFRAGLPGAGPHRRDQARASRSHRAQGDFRLSPKRSAADAAAIAETAISSPGFSRTSAASGAGKALPGRIPAPPKIPGRPTQSPVLPMPSRREEDEREDEKAATMRLRIGFVHVAPI